METSIKSIIAVLALAVSGASSALQTDIISGRSGTLFIKDGSLYCSGSLASGQCGDGGEYRTDEQKAMIASTYATKNDAPGSHEELYTFFDPHYVGVDNVKTVAAAYYKSMWLSEDGRVFWMGWSRRTGVVNTPTEIPDLEGASDIAAVVDGLIDNTYLYAVINGDVYVYHFEYGFAVKVNGLPSNIVAVDGEAYALFLTSDGKLFAAGNNENGALGDGTMTSTGYDYAAQVVDQYSQPLSGVQDFAAGTFSSIAIANGQVFTWGLNDDGALGIGDPNVALIQPSAAPIAFEGNAVDVDVNTAASILDANGDLYNFGWHNYGLTLRSFIPTNFVDGVTEIYPTTGPTFFLKRGGKLEAWGAGSYGALAHGVWWIEYGQYSKETNTLVPVSEFIGGPVPSAESENAADTDQSLICEPEVVTEYVEVPGPVEYVTEYVEVIKEVEVPVTVVQPVEVPVEVVKEVEVPVTVIQTVEVPVEVVKEVEVPVEVIRECEPEVVTEYIEVPGPVEYVTEYVEVIKKVEVPVTVVQTVEVPVEVVKEVEVPVEVIRECEPKVVTEYVEVPGPVEYVTEYVEVIKEVEVPVTVVQTVEVPVEVVKEVEVPVEVIREVEVPVEVEKEIPRDLARMSRGELESLLEQTRYNLMTRYGVGADDATCDGGCSRDDKGRNENDEKPGWGYGDNNHEHFGPPGQRGQ